MPLQQIQKSTFETSRNFTVLNIEELRNVPQEDREGTILVQGYSNFLDGGGGYFHWQPSAPVANDDNGIIIAPADADPLDSGCWVRILSSVYITLAWFGSNDYSVGNLNESYGYEGLVVNISEEGNGGFFQFREAEVVNHDGVNNFHGWCRLNDPNFTSNLKLNNQRITGADRAVGSTDVPNLEQVMELVATGDFVGVVPQYSPRYIGDGATSIFNTEASEADPAPDPLLVTGPSFEVTVDGLKMRHGVDFNVESDDLSPNFGKVIFVAPPALNAEIDIVWYSPIMANIYGDTAVTATESGTSHNLDDWVGAFGKDILVQATGTTAYKTLGDRFGANAVYFDTIQQMVDGYAQYKAGSICVVKGEYTAGDGYYGVYFIKTAAAATTDGDYYEIFDPEDPPPAGAINVYVPGPALVAVYQIQDYRLIKEETEELTSGQTVVNFTHAIANTKVTIYGDNVDDGFLVKDTDYTISGAGGNVMTLTESYPAGTKITLSWYDPSAVNELDFFADSSLVTKAKQMNLLGSGAAFAVNPSNSQEVALYVPETGEAVLTGSGTADPATANVEDSVASVDLTWSYSPDYEIENQTLTGSTLGSIAVTDSDRAKTVTGPITAEETFTIHGEGPFGNVDIPVVLEFLHPVFYGRDANTVLNEAQIEALSRLNLSDHEQEYTFGAGAGYLWIAYPASLGQLTQWQIKDSNTDVVFLDPVQTIDITLGSVVVSMLVQRSMYPINSGVTIVASK